MMKSLMFAKIYQPSKTAMSSGSASTKSWVLEFPPAESRDIDPLMGWISSDDTQTQVRLKFATKEEAVAYASANDIAASVQDPQKRFVNVRPGGYGDNFSTFRRGVWTH